MTTKQRLKTALRIVQRRWWQWLNARDECALAALREPLLCDLVVKCATFANEWGARYERLADALRVVA